MTIGGCTELQGGFADILSSGGLGGTGVSSGPLDESTVVAGLKEALRVGTERTVASTSRPDGYLGNSLIRIPLPENLDRMSSALRAIGFASQVDALEVAMNRAAEQAAGEAKTVFWDSVRAMSIADAFAILNGGETAATDYFRAETSAPLLARFQPIVREKMGAVGLYNLYNDLAGRYAQLPFVTQPALDLDEYVSSRALDGLFTVLASEETKIRQDPAARTTALLRRVFE